MEQILRKMNIFLNFWNNMSLGFMVFELMNVYGFIKRKRTKYAPVFILRIFLINWKIQIYAFSKSRNFEYVMFHVQSMRYSNDNASFECKKNCFRTQQIEEKKCCECCEFLRLVTISAFTVNSEHPVVTPVKK